MYCDGDEDKIKDGPCSDSCACQPTLPGIIWLHHMACYGNSAAASGPKVTGPCKSFPPGQHHQACSCTPGRQLHHLLSVRKTLSVLRTWLQRDRGTFQQRYVASLSTALDEQLPKHEVLVPGSSLGPDLPGDLLDVLTMMSASLALEECLVHDFLSQFKFTASSPRDYAISLGLLWLAAGWESPYLMLLRCSTGSSSRSRICHATKLQGHLHSFLQEKACSGYPETSSYILCSCFITLLEIHKRISPSPINITQSSSTSAA